MSTHALAHKLADFKDSLVLSVSLKEEAEDLLLKNPEQFSLAHYLMIESSEQINSQYFYLKETLKINRSLQKMLKKAREEIDLLARKGAPF